MQSPVNGSALVPQVPALRRLVVSLSQGALVFLSFFITSTTYAADLSGTWTASSLRVSWSVGDWGKACGPRPSGGGERGGTVTLTPSGSGFKLSGVGRSYATNQCWEQMPGLSAKSHSAGASAIKTTCSMPAGDPRQATVITTWFPRGDEIYFDETGQYQTVLQGSNCTASVRRTRVLTRVIAAPQPEPLAEEKKAEVKEEPKQEERSPVEEKKAVPSTAPPPPPVRSSHCAKAGKAVSLEVTPKTKLMRVGESFAFQAIARDQSGCRASVNTTWKLLSGGGGTLAPDGTITVPKDAAPGTLTLEAQVDEKSVTVTARVVTAEEYEELIAGGEYGVMGESLDAASIKLSASHVEFDAESGGAGDDGSKKTLLLVVAALLLALGGLTFFLISRRGRHPASSPTLHEVPDEEHADGAPTDSVEAAPGPPGLAPQPAVTVRLCPSCGKRYEDGTMFCGEDGSRLVRSN